MQYPLNYPKRPDWNALREQLIEYARLKYEYGASAEDIEYILNAAADELQKNIEKLQSLPEDKVLAALEPDDLKKIRSLRPEGPRKLWNSLDTELYKERLKGALIGRFAGCTLGAPVEFWSVENMEAWASYIGDAFPPEDYWSSIKNPSDKRYGVSECFKYTKPGIDGVPVDDDVTYTLLGLLILEDYGPEFTIKDAGAAWVKYLPCACTAEAVALENLRKGVPAHLAAEENNPYVQWIGADIRSDPWGYLAPGLPEKAAEFAYRDAYLSHRRNGIYGEMYFSAVISAAFAVGDIEAALRIGLTEIPADCHLAQDVRWALEVGDSIQDYKEARAAVEARFGDMSGVHTNLNACLTIFGLFIGGDDFTKAIGETVAMGYDNDCTAATVGSIFGAAKGIEAIPEKWYQAFNNKVYTYINGHSMFHIDDVFQRFIRQADALF